MGRVKCKAPHTADTRAKDGHRGFAGLPRCALASEAYRHLSMIARATLIEVVARMKGDNNGSINISYLEVAHALNRRNQSPIGPAFAQLIEHGFLDISADSVWQERKAREYRLTFVNTTDSSGRPIKATNEYLAWKPRAKNDATNVVAVRSKSVTPFVAGRIAAAINAVASPNGKPPKTLKASATNGVMPISLPYPVHCSGVGWWMADRLHAPTGGYIAVLSAECPSTAGIDLRSNSDPCECCAEPFEAGSRGKPKRFCSEACRKRAERQRAYRRNRDLAPCKHQRQGAQR